MEHITDLGMESRYKIWAVFWKFNIKFPYYYLPFFLLGIIFPPVTELNRLSLLLVHSILEESQVITGVVEARQPS